MIKALINSGSVFATVVALTMSCFMQVRQAEAADIIMVRRMTMELALDIARAAVQSCRDAGYQASAVIVDRNGIVQAVMRDTLANRFTLQAAESKANAVILAGVDSSEFRANRQDIRPEINQISDVLMMDGGVAIRAAGSIIGAVGVSGAPGGDKDEICARAGVEEVQDRLDFAD
ncbi:MAG: heme-binding protein [Rhodospirillaceae bacterium]|nr:heme-binding protein [Rhodospirillaceae bacterium]